MKITEIAKLHTIVLAGGNNDTHESILRSSQILEKVKYYLASGVPSRIILELIAEMEDKE